ncbi:MAG TPA: hypothetical protein DIC42_05955 [Holosporales bacterium]|nr:hypothetical protein [Holosporales bacterium]
MKISNTPLTALIHQRLKYLSKRSEILTGNIARADIPGAKRREIRPFRELATQQTMKFLNQDTLHEEQCTLDISQKDIQTENREIEREMEIMEMNHNSLNHQALLDIVSNFYKLYKYAISRSG